MPDLQHSTYYYQALRSATDYILNNDYASALTAYNTWIKQFGKRLSDEETEEIFKFFQNSRQMNKEYKNLIKKVP